MLSPNQALLMAAVQNAPEPISLERLSEMSREDGYPFGENSARNVMKRIEQRGWVVSTGKGKARSFSPTPEGIAALAEPPEAAAPAPVEIRPVTPDESPDNGSRRYVVLEQVTLVDLVGGLLDEADTAFAPDVSDALEKALHDHVIYEVVAEPSARNTEHALRQAAKTAFEGGGEPTLVPIAAKMFQPTVVKVNVSSTVSIGG